MRMLKRLFSSFPSLRGEVKVLMRYACRIDGATRMEDLDRELRRQMY